MSKTRLSTAAALAAALAAGLALAACQPAQEGANTTAAGQSESSPAGIVEKAGAVAGDAAITVAVNAALAKDDQLSALRINVDTVDGRVSLAGAAPNEAARDRATTLAQQVEGVKSVENRLAITPAS